ncbi:MAG: hypothetical protein HUK04_04065 [Bacteroidaceae bacterium]|nr:hypothetical protein [Bacteroidaceae bacterium]
MEINGRTLTPSGEFTPYGIDSEPIPYKYLTNDNGCFATIVHLGRWDSPENWRDATEGEYQEYMEQMEAEASQQEPTNE